MVKAAASQFDSTRIEVRRKHNLSSVQEVTQALKQAAECRAAVVYTLARPDLKRHLESEAKKLGLVTVDVMCPVIEALAKVTGQTPKYEPGLIRKVDKAYFSKVEAIEFAVKFDDGKDPRGLLKADVVVIGVSRTSKTPLCMYLAHKGIKAANVPLVLETLPPDELFQIPANKVVGLTIKPANLQEIRKQRLKLMGLPPTTDYVNMERLLAEFEYSSSVMRKVGCAVIDVTNRAVEETAANVLDIYQKGVRFNA
ncbi:putative pyruvate, phosphate dikinase regulatory protein [Methylomusa anaerophila]|uniref:Putative pyruvate, phosphate dikinase regulatory protein n=1 Tax=Methylomusa anaerophila TaxID=1930071 RepID=A0A348AML7_9FIRM|nr:putative pyruvate, phosphate dikinase regulatory protein [Methylomusa anaerophila]